VEDLTGDWRKLRNERIYNLHCLSDIIKVMYQRRWGETILKIKVKFSLGLTKYHTIMTDPILN
jgi:hypothetical protein